MEALLRSKKGGAAGEGGEASEAMSMQTLKAVGMMRELLRAVVEHEPEVVQRHVLPAERQDRDLLVLERRLALLHVPLDARHVRAQLDQLEHVLREEEVAMGHGG